MQQLDQTTHQNTSVAQESSSMAKRLKSQADGLNNAVVELMAVVTGSKNGDLKKHSDNFFNDQSTKILELPRRPHRQEAARARQI